MTGHRGAKESKDAQPQSPRLHGLILRHDVCRPEGDPTVPRRAGCHGHFRTYGNTAQGHSPHSGWSRRDRHRADRHGQDVGVSFARDLVSEPGNVIYPETLADRCTELTAQGIEVEVLDEAQLEKIGMRTLLAVGMGSERDSRVVVMRWMGADDDDAALATTVISGEKK